MLLLFFRSLHMFI